MDLVLDIEWFNTYRGEELSTERNPKMLPIDKKGINNSMDAVLL